MSDIYHETNRGVNDRQIVDFPSSLCLTPPMSTKPFSLLLVTAAATMGLLFGAIPTVQAKTMVGTPCTKLGAIAGNGPGGSVICTTKGKKKIWQVLPRKSPSRQGQQNSPQTPSNSPQPTIAPTQNCTKLPEFTADFIDPSYVRDVTPIGEQTGTGGVIAVRSYIHPKSEFLGKELPIYAPVDMTLNSANYYKVAGASASYQPEYSLYFDAGCGISVKFFHIKGVVGKVAGVVPTEPMSSSAGQPVTPTRIRAGEQIGWYKLGENSVAFDFWVDNEAHANDFIVASHFASSNALHSVCPYDLYIPVKRDAWLAKLGAPGSDPVPGTSCGVVTEGLAGTADGMWFIGQDTITDHLTYDGAYQSQIMFSTDPSGLLRIGGLNASGSPTQMMVNPQSSTWIKPSDVVVGASHCWSNDTQSVAVTLTSKTTMSVIVGTGSCTTLPATSTGKTYYR